MAYEKTNWIDNETKVSAAKMNKIEEKLFSLDANKIDKDGNKVLSTEDYTSTEKAKVANLPDDTNAQLAEKAKAVDVYTKQQVDAQLAEKAPQSTTYTKTEVDVKDELKADKLKATNLVTNGDFSQGTTGWTSVSSSGVVADGIYTNTSSGATVYAFTEQTISVKSTIGKKIYIGAKILVENADCVNVRFRLYDGVNTLASSNPLPTKDIWTSVSHVFECIRDGTTNMIYNIMHQYTSISLASGKSIKFTKPIVIDLTTIFGAGNEPTKEQMDRLLAEFPNSWFDGTQEILPLKVIPQLLDEKANKTQEAWQTLTLLNGITGTLKIMKDSFGFVHLEGEVFKDVWTAGLSITTIPIGYRPEDVKHFLSPANYGSTAIRAFLIAASGNVVNYGTIGQRGYINIVYKAGD